MQPDLLEGPTSIFLVLFIQVFIFLCFFFSLIYGVGELTLFALIILVLGLGAHMWSRISRNHVSCKIMLSRDRLFPGEKLGIDIEAVNGKPLPVLFRVNLFVPGDLAGSDSGAWINEETGLLWFQKARFRKAFRPDRRGVYDLGPPRMRTGDIFGFSYRRSAAHDHFEVIVYPRIVDIRPIAVPQRDFFGTPGAKSPVEDPVFVFGTRDYQPGRPSRKIHWKASARHNRLQEKLCEPAEQEKILFILDAFGFEAGDDFEKTLEVIASLVVQLDRRGIAVGFATNCRIYGNQRRIIPISRNSLQLAAILETIARAEATPTAAITDILANGYTIPWGVSCICFSWDRSSRTIAAQTFMAHRNTPIQLVLAKESERIGNAGAERGDSPVYLKDILEPEEKS